MSHAVLAGLNSPDQHRKGIVAIASVGLLLASTMLATAPGSAASAATSATSRAPSPASACTANVDRSLRRTGGAVDVIVVGAANRGGEVAAAVSRAGGRVSAVLSMVDGVRASVPAAALSRLGCSPGVASVTPNSVVRFAGHDGGSDSSATASDYVRETGALPLWRKGDDGTGVGVAVIDTGISPMNDVAGRIVNGPDLSGEGTIIDSYGHGTVMAGIIGGDGHDSARESAGPNTGMAPGATLVSVKVAGRNGAADVSTMLEAMHWVSAYRHEFNIRVLNLSWGTPSTQSPTVDPLDYAVERLWRQGIVVVAAAGNAGSAAGTILKPADDPLVITAGAYRAKPHPHRPPRDMRGGVELVRTHRRRNRQAGSGRARAHARRPAFLRFARRGPESRGRWSLRATSRAAARRKRPPSPRAPSRCCCRRDPG